MLPGSWTTDGTHVGSRLLLLLLLLPLGIWPLWSSGPGLHLWRLMALSRVAVLQVWVGVMAGSMVMVGIVTVVSVVVGAVVMIGIRVVAGVSMRVSLALVGAGIEATGRVMGQVYLSLGVMTSICLSGFQTRRA